MIYNVHYDVCAMIIALFAVIFILAKKGMRLEQNKILFVLLVATFFASFFDIVSSIGNSYVEEWSYLSRDILNYTYLILHNGMCLLFCIYIMSVCDIRTKCKQVSKLVVIPCTIDILILMLNPFLKWAFYYDENKVYTHSIVFNVLYFNAFLYLAISAYFLHRYGKNVVRSKIVMGYVFIFSCIFSVGLQMLIPNVLISLCVESLGLLGMLLVIDNEDEITDSLTKCFNRNYFVQVNKQRISDTSSYGVIGIKILQKNRLTATFGIELCNQVMTEIGTYFKKAFGDDNVFYYTDGVFTVILHKYDQVEAFIRAIEDRFVKNWLIGDISIQLEVNCVEIQIGEKISTVEELLIELDSIDKAQIGACEMREVQSVSAYRREIAVKDAIIRAVENKEVELSFQPICDYEKNCIIGVEALVRIEDEILGSVEMDEIVWVAEKNALYAQLDMVIIEKICSVYTEKEFDKLGVDIIDIKPSKLQFFNFSFCDTVLEILAKYNMEPRRLCIQIEIDLLFESQSIVYETLNHLKEKGFQLIINRYRMVSLTSLNRVPFDMIRFDKDVLSQAMEASKARILLKNTIRMFHEIEVITILEGVDDLYSKELAIEVNGDLLQGNYYSEPVEAESLFRYCRGFNLR